MSVLASRGLRVAAAAAALLVIGVVPSAAQPAQAQSYVGHCSAPLTGLRKCVYTFTFTGTIEPFVVPATTRGPIRITAVGAPGAGEDSFVSRGAVVTGSFHDLNGMLLHVAVGGEGFYDGYNGGGPGGGGGASDVRVGLPELDRRIIVAGGGGGWGQQLVFDEENGYGFVSIRGGDAGQPGLAFGGQPGTQSAGGAGGGEGPNRGGPGVFGQGGGGGEDGGGGGGGGYYGGGGGGGCWGGDGRHTLCVESKPGSGGGGSSLVPPGGTFALSDNLVPHVTIELTQYGYN